jgi:methionine sulfoxide reductase heme-binding subunit
MTAPTQAHRRRHPLAVWRDPAGRLSWLRIATLAALLVPAGIAAWDGLTVGYGPRPLNDVIHRTGYWALIFLLASLAVTPLSRLGRFGLLLDVRRMIGVGAFVYAVAHILLYVADLKYDVLRAASEIVLRVYLTIGFVALLGLGVLTATSTDAMVRRLGANRWQRLHRIVYALAVLAIVHYFQQNKVDVWAPTLVAGLLTWMLGYRLIASRRRNGSATLALIALAVAAAVLTFAAEAIGIAIAFNTSPMRVLQSAFEFDWYSIRPGWFVLGVGLAAAALDAARARRRKAERPPVSAPA